MSDRTSSKSQTSSTRCMVETIEKATLEDMVKTAYEHLNTLLASLSEEQKTTPGVKSSFVLMRALCLSRQVWVVLVLHEQ